MDANDFWKLLEYRVCREIDGLRDNALRALWCDGFIPEQFERIDDQPAITGRVWIGRGGTHQEQWRFSLFLSKSVDDETEIDWAALLPANDVTGWLSLDPSQRAMKVDPKAAYPDRQPAAR